MEINRCEIESLTEKYGGAWGINHTRRLLCLVEDIGEGRDYNRDAIWLAAHLHDWGAYAPWAQAGVDHAVRSTQVAEEFLKDRPLPEEFKALVVECIAKHHTAGSDMSLEAMLLRDADVLDFLGIVGILRDVSKNPRELRKAYDAIRKRRDTLPGLLRLEKARKLGAERVKEMDRVLAQWEGESCGNF